MGGSKKQTTGYRYSMTIHMGICLRVDAVLDIIVAGRTAWTGFVTANTTEAINARDLFGGDKREGGIQGNCDFLLGGDDQMPDGMLSIIQGGLQPGYRGFLSLVYDGLIASNNPYIKPWAVRVMSITQGWSGGSCWYPETANIVSSTTDTPALIENFSAGNLADYSTLEGDGTGFTWTSSGIVTGQAATSGHHNVIGRPLSAPAPLYRARVKIKLTQVNADDGGAMTLRDAGGQVIFSINSCRDAAYDALRRPSVTFHDQPGAPGNLMGAGQLTLNTWYRFEALYDPDALTFSCSIVEDATGAVFDSIEVPVTARADISYLAWMVDDFGGHGAGQGAGSTTWTDAEIIVGAKSGAMNPAHIIYQCLTDPDWGMGYPTATIDDASFRAAADQLFAEGFGVCFKWTNQATIQDFTQTVADHAGLVFGQDRKTGLFRILLLRDNYNIDDLPVFTQKDVRVVKYQRTALADTVNEILVDYIDGKTGEDATTPPAQNLANIQGQGRVVSTTMNFSGLPTESLATRVAMRELRARSTPLWQLQLEFKRVAFDLFPGEPFVMDLLDHPIGAKLVLRAGEIDFGQVADATIRADTVEDVFGLPDAVYIGQSPDVLPPTTAPVAATTGAFEAPYVELVQRMTAADIAALPTDAGYLGATGVKPSSSTQNYELYTRIPPADFATAGQGDFAPTGLLGTAVGKSEDDTELALTAVVDLDQLETGTAAFLGEHPDAEMVRIDAVDTTTSIVTVGRGCGDTVPKEWPIGTRLWCYDDFSAADVQQYIDGETVEAKLATHSGSGTLALADATAASVTMDSRVARPYPPGLVRINGDEWPAAAAPAGSMSITWAHRDRVLQADTLLDTSAASVGPESSVRYGLRFSRADTSALLVERLDLAGPSAGITLAYTGDVVMQLYAISDNGESWQRHIHTFTYTAPAGAVSSVITGTTYQDTGGTVIDGGVVTGPITGGALPPSVAAGGTGIASILPARTRGATSVSVATYGALGNGVHDDTAAFNAAYAALPGDGGTVTVPAGTYLIDPTVKIKPLSNTLLSLDIGAILKAKYTATDHVYIVEINSKVQVEIAGGTFTGFRDSWSPISGTTSEWAHAIGVWGSSHVTIRNTTLQKNVGDGISIGPLGTGITPDDVLVDQAVITNNRRNGVSIGTSTNCKVTNCEISFSNGTSPKAGIDVECDNPEAPNQVHDVLIDGNNIHDCAGAAVQCYKATYSVTITNNQLDYCNWGVYTTDSHSGLIKGNLIRHNRYPGVVLGGSTTGFVLGGGGSLQNTFFNNTTTSQGVILTGSTVSLSAQSSATAKHLSIGGSVTGTTLNANLYGPP